MTHPTIEITETPVKHRIWIFSDLQQSDPEAAQRCFDTAMEDFRQLGLTCDYIWYLQCHQKISWVAQQNIPQVNVSSLENRRGSGIRSVFLEIYEDRRLGVFFRNHQLQRWEEALKV